MLTRVIGTLMALFLAVLSFSEAKPLFWVELKDFLKDLLSRYLTKDFYSIFLLH